MELNGQLRSISVKDKEALKVSREIWNLIRAAETSIHICRLEKTGD